jgi:hypothetical protein
VAGRAQALFRFTVPVIDMPGTHSAIVAIREKPPLRGFGEPAPTITATAAIGVPVRVYVPCPDRCIGLTFAVGDVALGEPALFSAQVSNVGSKDIGNITGYVEVNNDRGIVTTLPFTSSAALAPGKNIMLNSEWDTTDATVGAYTANAVVLYDEFSQNATDKFRVGDFLLKIIGLSPQKIIQGGIANFYVSIESVWNEPINSIYGILQFKDTAGAELAQVTTPTLNSIAPWSMSSLNALLDIRNQPVGNYTVSTEVYYEGKISNADFPVSIVEKEESQQPKAQFKIDSTTMMILALIMLIIALLYLRERKRRAQSKLF